MNDEKSKNKSFAGVHGARGAGSLLILIMQEPLAAEGIIQWN